MKYFVQRVMFRSTVFTLMICSPALHAVITFYIRPYPSISMPTSPQTAQQTHYATESKTSVPLEYYLLSSPSNIGILATYGGYLAVSDLTGQIMFPRRHEKPSMHLLVTNKITPVIMIANTIHHWEIQLGIPAQMYLIERREDPQTNLLYWDVQQTTLPENNIIPLDTITILASPDHVYIPEGATLSSTNPQLILPDIYVKEGIERLNQALYAINIKRFFGLVRFAYQKDALLFMKLISN